MTLSEEVASLQRAAHDLMYLGMDGSPIYSDDLSRRNNEVYRLTTTLYNSGIKGSTVEEQALCLSRSLNGLQRIVHRPRRKARTCPEDIRSLLGYPRYSSRFTIEAPLAYRLLW